MINGKTWKTNFGLKTAYYAYGYPWFEEVKDTLSCSKWTVHGRNIAKLPLD